MKKLMLVSDESILGGCARSGVAEVVDSLGNALTEDYAVSVVCPDGNGVWAQMAANLRQFSDGVRTCRLFGVDYYLLRHWPDGLVTVAEAVTPDVLHNFAAPELLTATSSVRVHHRSGGLCARARGRSRQLRCGDNGIQGVCQGAAGG